MGNPETPGQVKLVVGDQHILGTYSNFVSIVHNFSEFIVDFGRIVPGREEVGVVSRVVMTPVHVKQLLRALAENVAIYERTFGEIPEGPKPAQVPGRPM